MVTLSSMTREVDRAHSRWVRAKKEHERLTKSSGGKDSSSLQTLKSIEELEKEYQEKVDTRMAVMRLHYNIGNPL